MRLTWLPILIAFFSSFSILGQTKIVTGKIIDEFDLKGIPGIRIQNADTTILTQTDLDGKFKVEVPVNEQSLLISGVGYEWANIYFNNNCDRLEIVMMPAGTYDYMSLKKVDKLRMKRFKKLPQFHLTAYRNGEFETEQACYQRPFSRSARKNK
jgi:hypothetical protein